MVEVDDDVIDLAKRLREIDTSLGLDYSEDGKYFRVYQLVDDGRGGTKRHTVTTSQELNAALIERVRYIAHPDYEYSKEIERRHDRVDAEHDHRYHERVGDAGEKLHWALSRDLQFKNKIYVPRWP